MLQSDVTTLYSRFHLPLPRSHAQKLLSQQPGVRFETGIKVEMRDVEYL